MKPIGMILTYRFFFFSVNLLTFYAKYVCTHNLKNPELKFFENNVSFFWKRHENVVIYDITNFIALLAR